MTEEVVLLNWWASPFGMRVKIALSEKGVEYEHREEDLFHNKSPLLLKSNPINKSIPVLIHNGKPVCESLLIVQYIDETWSNKSPLIPRDPYERARARFWADFADKEVPTLSLILWFVTPFISYKNMAVMVQCPKLVEWGKRCMVRPSVCAALPPQDKVYNLMLELRGLRPHQQH